MNDPDIAVLRQKIHGMPAADYADVIRERLPDYEVALATTPDEERELLRTVRVATGISLPTDLLPEASNLGLFACAYAGTSHLDLDEFAAHDVAVTSASGVHGPNIAEYVVGGIVYFTRGFDQARDQQERRRWQSYPGDELMGSTVTVVGLGSIGEALVERLDPFGVETLGVRYTPSKGGPTDEVFGFDEIHDPLSRTDYLVLACPLTETTRGLIGDDEFRSLPPDALVLNVARGPVVDTQALMDALRANDVRGAVLDVTDPEPLPEDHPLWGFDDVLITPHNAGHTPKYYDRLADILAENVERAAETGAFDDLHNQVV